MYVFKCIHIYNGKNIFILSREILQNNFHVSFLYFLILKKDKIILEDVHFSSLKIERKKK